MTSAAASHTFVVKASVTMKTAMSGRLVRKTVRQPQRATRRPVTGIMTSDPIPRPRSMVPKTPSSTFSAVLRLGISPAQRALIMPAAKKTT